MGIEGKRPSGQASGKQIIELIGILTKASEERFKHKVTKIYIPINIFHRLKEIFHIPYNTTFGVPDKIMGLKIIELHPKTELTYEEFSNMHKEVLFDKNSYLDPKTIEEIKNRENPY